ncbi:MULTISPECIES: amidohydrolase [unclassified Paracoccus (in: a-proteobacteria)]|uniref:amidohydrolase n=1 Tax=unclassified Paracoccus (in: a-proteobacteria) TaxID=2688777 RepID=UPI0012B1A94B|nr:MULTISPECIES: amidohydrolase [unclassified Paracoccus (in: a-proteobacteria)]UXU76664.1 amidohydrolase [Paracoccus sp. SMMA_5]UXU82554.1 amidohydrolase [Paracoccus sp. SMMA_5_TC]
MTADLLIVNARTRPMFAAAGTTALAVADGRILALGSDAQIRDLAGPRTRIINAGGRELMPGFVESHLHLFMGGATLAMLNLGSCFGFDQARAAFRRFIDDNPGDEILFAYAVNYTIFGEDRRPDRHLLDAICADRPIALLATDLHCAWANTCALQQAGILQGGDVGPGSEIVLGADGLASGELREFAAMQKIRELSRLRGRDGLDYAGGGAVTAADRAHDQGLIARAGDFCARHGITSAVNMDGNAYQAGLMRDLALAGQMPVRVSLPLRLVAADGPEGVARIDDFGPEVPGWLRFGRVKLFMDGVYDTWTALTVSDYPDRPGFRSEPLIAPPVFDAICIEADRRGLQLATHAVGDGAVRATIDGYAAARRANGARDSRHRIEHIDTIHPSDLDRLAPLGIVASMQPVHPPGSAGLPLEPTTTIMGRDRWPTAFGWRMILDRQVPLAFGTDWPVSPLSPLYAIHCALTRRPWAADMPDQRISLEECLHAYTLGGAHADFADHRRGSLRPGQDADLVLIDGRLEDLADSASAAGIALTVCGGRVTHRAI